jgi:XrtJ-associated TM-motif-TM protein
MKFRLCLIAAMLLLAAGTAKAQSGCTDSPECPTAVLGLVGAAGLAAARWFEK